MLSDAVLAVTIVIFLLHSTKYSCSASCKVGSNIVSVRYSDTIVNHTLVGPIMSNITAKNERECEMECHLAVPLGMCYMFNYHPSSKVCELLYKDRAAEYKAEKKKGSTYKTRKCASNPCVNGQCYSLGENTRSSCMCDPLYEGSTCKICKPAKKIYVDTITNYTIVGPLLKSLTARDEEHCKCECQDSCYMFNYYPSSKVCELFYGDRPAEYKLEKNNGSTFSTQKCAASPCFNGGTCISFGEQSVNNSKWCLCETMFNGSLCQSPNCNFTSRVSPYTNAMLNYSIVGSILWSFTATSETACQCACDEKDQGLCHAFNFNPLTRLCELFYKDTTGQYSVVGNQGTFFKAQKCDSNPCLNEGKCYTLGNQTNKLCLCHPLFTGPICATPICKIDPNVPAITYIDAVANYTITGPVLRSLRTINQMACECTCQMTAQGLCYMFNFNSSSQLCELFYKDRSAEYTVVPKAGMTFKTQTCDSNPCLNEGKCYVLGDQTNKLCLCHPLFTGPICANPICKTDPNVSAITYIDAVANYTITGPVLRSLRTINQMACECTCQMTAQGSCYMFNFNSSSKLCELFYKDRSAEYTVVPQAGMTFKTQRCKTNTCYTAGGVRCYSLGDDDNNKFCLCAGNFSGKYCHVTPKGIKVNTSPVCIGAKDDTFGTFVAPFNGKVKTFRLVHLSGGVAHVGAPLDYSGLGNWGTKEYFSIPLLTNFEEKIELHVTYDNNVRVTPPPSYPVEAAWERMGYDLPGYNNTSPELIFPEISPRITVAKGQRFRIWFGQDLKGIFEFDNLGTTCADVYILYTE